MKRTTNIAILILTTLTLAVVTTGCVDMLDDVLEHDFEQTDDSANTDDSADNADDSSTDDGSDSADSSPDSSSNELPTVPDNPGWSNPPAPSNPPASNPPAAEPEDVIPDVDATLNDALIRIFIVGSTMSVSVEADWSATGADDLLVDLEVLSSMTYRSWTPILTNQPAVYFESTTISAVQGERRFDFRIVAHDSAGNEWISNVITIQ